MARKKSSPRAKPAKKKRATAKIKAGKKIKVGKRVAAKTARRSAKARTRKAPPAKRRAAKKDVLGEGNYTASRNFRKKETAFVQRNKARIPALGKAAETALEGPQGDELRAAEAEARARSMPDA